MLTEMDCMFAGNIRSASFLQIYIWSGKTLAKYLKILQDAREEREKVDRVLLDVASQGVIDVVFYLHQIELFILLILHTKYSLLLLCGSVLWCWYDISQLDLTNAVNLQASYNVAMIKVFCIGYTKLANFIYFPFLHGQRVLVLFQSCVDTSRLR